LCVGDGRQGYEQQESGPSHGARIISGSVPRRQTVGLAT
jgi:hypothetical protein